MLPRVLSLHVGSFSLSLSLFVCLSHPYMPPKQISSGCAQYILVIIPLCVPTLVAINPLSQLIFDSNTVEK